MIKMIELLWILVLFSPIILFSINFQDTSIKTVIIFCAVFYVLLYANMGYAFQLIKIPINTFSVFVTVLIIDTVLIFYHINNNKFKRYFKVTNVSTIDLLLPLFLVLSFFLYYYNQSRFFSLIAPDAWYWFSGLNFIADNGFLFHESMTWEYDILYWYPDGFHYLWGITFLPFSPSISYNAIKFIGPIFGVLTLLGLWEYFSEHKPYLILASIIYYVSMPDLIQRFSMFIPETIGIYMVVFICLVLKKYELSSNVAVIIGITLGLFTNIYHSTGLIIFFIVGIIFLVSRKHSMVKYLFFYLLGATFFLIPYVLDPKGLFLYNSHIVEVILNPSLWNNWIKTSGIIFYANPGTKYTAIGAPILGFPLIILYLSICKNKKRLFDKSILFNLLLLSLSLLLGISYYFYATSLSHRSIIFFSVSSVLLFPSFFTMLQETFNKYLKNKSKILYIFLILLILNRILIVSFTYPIFENQFIEEESSMLVWMDCNLPLDSTIVIGENMYKYGENKSNREIKWKNMLDKEIKRILYPRKVFFGEDNYSSNNTTYYLYHVKLPIENNYFHMEHDLILSGYLEE